MSGLEIAAASIGIADVAVRSILAFYDYCKALQGAPKEVIKARDEVKAVIDCANGLKFLEHATIGLRNKIIEIGLRESIEICGKACKEFEGEIVRWSKDGVDKNLSKTKIARHRDRYETYVVDIATTKSNITLAIRVANLYILTEERSASEAEKAVAAQSLRNEIERLTAEAKREHDETDRLRNEFERKYVAVDSANTESQLRDAERRVKTYNRLALNCGVAVEMVKELAVVDIQVGKVMAEGDSSLNKVGLSKDTIEKVRSARMQTGDMEAKDGGKNEIGVH